MNLACLVDKAQLKEFEKSVFEAAKMFDNHYAFDFTDPIAPFSFVNLSLETA